MDAIITQARVNSTRLPNKIFLKAGGNSFFYHHIQRLKKTGLPIIVATTNNGSEKPIIDFCVENNITCFCGSEENVLERFYLCAKKYHLKNVIRVTSDCPLIDPNIIKNGLMDYNNLKKSNVYFSNTIERTYPRGMDYEIFSFQLLEDAFKNAVNVSDKEHVTPFLWKNITGEVIIKQDLNKIDNADLRITLDTEEDKLLIIKLIEGYKANELSCNEIVAILRNNKELIEINKAIEQKKV